MPDNRHPCLLPWGDPSSRASSIGIRHITLQSLHVGVGIGKTRYIAILTMCGPVLGHSGADHNRKQLRHFDMIQYRSQGKCLTQRKLYENCRSSFSYMHCTFHRKSPGYENYTFWIKSHITMFCKDLVQLSFHPKFQMIKKTI